MSELVPNQPRLTRGNTLLVQVPQRVADTLLVGGKELYFDGTYAEHFNKVGKGLVVCAPAGLGDQHLLARMSEPTKSVPVSAIADELRVGDELYVDWSAVEPHNLVAPDVLEWLDLPGEGDVYQVTVNQVLARVREGALIPYGSYVLLKEVFPADVQPVEVGGHTLMLRLSASGLALGSESVPAERYQGTVAHVGLPLRGQPQRLAVGDRAVFLERFCAAHDGLPLRAKLEGEEYLCIRADYIVAILS